MKLGFNLSIERKTENQIIEEIEYYYSVSDQVIELSLTSLYGILNFPFEKISPLLKQFQYRSIHLPVITGEDRQNNEFLVYPHKKLDQYINVIKEVAKEVGIQTYILHPDQVMDFDWANQEFGNLLGFENMDNKKKFGRTVSEMEEVFKKCPQANFIFDVNHLYTNDFSMNSASSFYSAFKDRLTHYHISALGKDHDSFTAFPREISILDGVFDMNVPMVHEGYKISYANAKEEHTKILEYIKEKREK
jgi:hypothetical protein